MIVVVVGALDVVGVVVAGVIVGYCWLFALIVLAFVVLCIVGVGCSRCCRCYSCCCIVLSLFVLLSLLLWALLVSLLMLLWVAVLLMCCCECCCGCFVVAAKYSMPSRSARTSISARAVQSHHIFSNYLFTRSPGVIA